MKRRICYLCVVSVLLLNLILGYRLVSDENSRHTSEKGVLHQIDNLMKILQLIRTQYIDGDSISMETLFQGAFEGIASKLDPYSCYLPPDDLGKYIEMSDGEFAGIGMVIQNEKDKIVVIAVYPDTPAAAAGIETGDELLKINGQPINQEDSSNVRSRLRGKAGSRVSLTLFSHAQQAEYTKDIVRAKIISPTVQNVTLFQENTIGYLQITQFTRHTANDLEKELKQLEQKKISGLILDLRGNPGGLLQSASAICSFFLPNQALIVTTRSRKLEDTDKDNTETYRSKPGYKFPNSVKLVILIDGYSASAAEIMAGCLQDHKKAILVGDKSFGKGSVQNFLDLGDGSALKLTVARYYTPDPKRKTIDKNGIQPDIQLKLSHKEAKELYQLLNKNIVNPEKDAQLKKAIQVLQSNHETTADHSPTDASEHVIPTTN